ncbi:MAG: efflux RND transporter periplasmic adaptor subunit [Rhodospirillaceae bacterium]|nr:efflux RND transporter periplasmic adaptor subunit [Rhodospirillaceae bacterium]MBT6136040.1 efflux RND transporter periplasmic adaptor subunit [Rhodospirillaceae bacterium]
MSFAKIRSQRISLRRLNLTASALLLGATLFVAQPASAQKASPVGVDMVRSEILAQTTPVLGRFVARESGVVATRIAERVAKMPVQIGDRVKRGAVLARLSDDRLRSQRTLRVAEAKRAAARIGRDGATLAKYQQALKRISALKGSNAFRQDRQDDAERDLEVANSALLEAEAELAKANANLELADIALKDTTIRAPYPGVVTARHTLSGNYVRAGDPIVTLLNDRELEIEADIPVGRIAGLVQGSMVVATLHGGFQVNASVRAVIPAENTRTRTRAVRFSPDLSKQDDHIAENQSVSILIPIGDKRSVVTVHKDAVLARKGRHLVFVVTDGKVQPRPVTLGEAAGARFEILKGLKAGETVVVRGNERLRPGQAVKPIKAGGS